MNRKAAAIEFIDENVEALKDAFYFLSLLVVGWTGRFVSSLSDEAYLYGNAATILSIGLALYRTHIIYADRRDRRAQIAADKARRKEALLVTRTERNRQRRIEENKNAMCGHDLKKVSSGKKISKALEANSREKLDE